MKSLVVFYSRTGNTKKAAEAIGKALKSDVEEIFDTKNRKGIIGYILSGRDATLKRHTKLRDTKMNPSSYDLVVIGTPIWAYNVCAPIRTYMHMNNGRFRKVAFFCTMGGSGDERAFSSMEKLAEKRPIATLTLLTKEVAGEKYSDKVRKFAAKLR